jgi:hypothetical protein
MKGIGAPDRVWILNWSLCFIGRCMADAFRVSTAWPDGFQFAPEAQKDLL